MSYIFAILLFSFLIFIHELGTYTADMAMDILLGGAVPEFHVNRKKDGTLYPTFNRPQFSERFSFHEYTRR